MTDLYIAPGGSDSNPGTITQPFATLAHARDVVRGINAGMNADINVWLRGGTYFLSSTLVLTEADSGNNGFNVKWQAFPNETPIISGGRQITGWSGPDGNGNFHAPTGGLIFRELYVNDVPAIPARYPNLGAYPPGTFRRAITWGNTGFTVTGNEYIKVNASDVNFISNPVGVEFWFMGGICNMMHISSITYPGDGTANVFFNSSELTNSYFISSFRRGNNPFWLQNAIDFVANPGDWYLNTSTNTVYYRPRTGENLATATVIAPVVEQLINISGSSLDNVAHNIQFLGLSFRHAGWLYPNSNGVCSFTGTLNGFQPGAALWRERAIYVSNAQSLLVQGCDFRNLASIGIHLDSGSASNTIDRNTFTALGSHAVASGLGIMAAAGFPSDSRAFPNNNHVQNNTIANCGFTYVDSFGIFGGYHHDDYFEHNEISFAPFMGIFCGLSAPAGAVRSSNIFARYNNIHSVMQLAEDGGVIYTQISPSQVGSRIDENYIHDITQPTWTEYGGQAIGLYFDQGTQFNVARNNVIENFTPSTNWLTFAGPNNTIYNIDQSHVEAGSDPNQTFIFDASLDPVAVKANAGPTQSFTPSPDGTTVPPASQIVDNQGNVWTLATDTVQSGHTILKNGTSAAGGQGILLEWFSSSVYTKNNIGNWYIWNGSAWVLTSAPGGPNPTCLIDAFGNAFIDSKGNALVANNITSALINTTTTLTAVPNPVTIGKSAVFTATVTPASGNIVPTGNVTFFDGSANLGTLPLNGAGQASLTFMTTLHPQLGPHSITAVYAGDQTYLGSTSAPLFEIVLPVVSSYIRASRGPPWRRVIR